METNTFMQAVRGKMMSSSSCPVFRNLLISIQLNPVNACLPVFLSTRPCVSISSGTKGEHDFAAAKTTNPDVVGDVTEINSANPQILVVENQHINPPEELVLMANTESYAPKKPVRVLYFKPLPKLTQCEKKRKSKKVSSSILTSTPIKEILEKREKQKEEQEILRKQGREAREAKKGVKELILSSCRPKSIKSRPNSPVASISKGGVIRWPACEEEYCDPPI
ncbi:uncharacterized protein TNCV_1490281 [Trichonephila clavipes]|nr:uncharacterized protein TNCV_1490281 [Trichonephila clavipes]